MRLTKKNEEFSCGYEAIEELTKQQNASPIIEKLGKLEDIEDKLGVDLILYLKMCVIGTSIFVLDKTLNEVFEMTYHTKFIYNPDLKVFGFFAPPDGGFIPRFKMSEYGKTWALSKDELNK